MAISKFLYPIDITGQRQSNRIEEQHSIGSDGYRAFALYHGPFYTDSLEIRETGTGRRLEPGDDYKITFFYQELTMMTAGKEIAGVIVVKNDEISPDVTVNANIFGGPFVSHGPLIADAIAQLELDDRNVYWANVLEKPDLMQALPHLNDIGDVFGFEYIIDQLAGMKEAMLVGNNSMLEGIKESIVALRASMEAALREHEENVGNPHKTTNNQVNAYTKEYINQLESNIESLIADLEPRFDSIDETIAYIRQQYNALTTNITALTGRQSDLEATYQQIHQLIADINESIRDVNTEIGRIDDELAALRAADLSLQQAIDAVESTVADIKGDVDANSNDINAIKTKNNQQDSEINSLKSRMSSAESTINSIISKNTQQDSAINALDGRLDTAEAAINSIKTKNSQQDTAIGNLQSAVTSINQEISGIKTKNSQQDTAISTAQARADYAVSIASSKLSDAPKDGKIYGRRNGVWVESIDAELIQDILDRLDWLESEVRKLTRTIEGVTTDATINIDEYFTDEEIRNKDCTLIVRGCKIGGGDRQYGSLHTKKGTWRKLTVIVTGTSQIIGRGGNGDTYNSAYGNDASTCPGENQQRTDGGHAITFPANTNTYVIIDPGCTVIGGGAGGKAGWRVACGYSNSGTGGAGGGGAGFPPGRGGKKGYQTHGTCFCSSANHGGDATETTGGKGGTRTGALGSGSNPAYAQDGSNGGDLGKKASRPDGVYPIGEHGAPGSAVVGAKNVTYN